MKFVKRRMPITKAINILECGIGAGVYFFKDTVSEGYAYLGNGRFSPRRKEYGASTADVYKFNDFGTDSIWKIYFRR